MAKYVVLSGGFYVASVFVDTRHVWLTKEKDDASVWSDYAKAVKTARFVEETTRQPAFVQAVPDADG